MTKTKTKTKTKNWKQIINEALSDKTDSEISKEAIKLRKKRAISAGLTW